MIDRKIKPAYSLVIQAKDNGVPALSSTTKLQIVVLSVSDIPPKFDQLGYTFNITENNQVNAVVGQIKVTASKNLVEERIVMSILNDESGLFFLTSTDNILKVGEYDFFCSLSLFRYQIFCTFYTVKNKLTDFCGLDNVRFC